MKLRKLNFFSIGNSRTIAAKKNIIGSFISKIIAVIVSLLLIPLTIEYVNSAQYGIWLTISSMVSWISYFDMGLAHGFRNRFAESKAVGSIDLAKRYVSTTYLLLISIFSITGFILLIVNRFISWSSVLGVDESMNHELYVVFNILIISFCIQLVLKIFTTLLTADQKPALSSLIITTGQIFVLISVIILRTTTKGNLVYLAYALSGIPPFSLLIISIIGYSTMYKEYIPSIRKVDFSLSKKIVGLGIKFFLIQLSLLLIFQITNIIIINKLGSETVTEYNISYKYFGIVFMIANIVILPFWSAFTDAYSKNDFNWMKSIYKKLHYLWYLSIPALLVMFLLMPYAYRYWLDSRIDVDYRLALFMVVYIIIMTRSSISMQLINGIGKIKLQLYIYVSFAIISVPCMIWITESWGLPGILVYLSFVYLVQLVVGHTQLVLILNKKAIGIWNK